MCERIWVVAKPGQKCPKETAGSGMIGSVPVQVPATRYYRRLIADGSLVETRPVETRKKKAEVIDDTK